MAIALMDAATQRVDRVRTGPRTRVETICWNGYDVEFRATKRAVNAVARTKQVEARYRLNVDESFAAAVTSRTRHFAIWQPVGVQTTRTETTHSRNFTRRHGHGFMNHTLHYLTGVYAGTNLRNCRTVESALRQLLLCAWQLMKQDFAASLRADPNFIPKFMIELVHTGVSYAIAKAAETNLQILLGVDEPNHHHQGSFYQQVTATHVIQ